jgi:DNA-binding transcriptional MerR regulator
MKYTPAQIANQLNVSTTTLRRYEEQNLIPDVPRTPSNHRYYLPIHFQAFITIRALLKGYEIPVVYEAMRNIKTGDMKQALWLINNQQYKIEAEKKRVDEILLMIKSTDFPKYKNVTVTDKMSIGEVAEMAGVNTSSIRHWEKEGLIHSDRNKENGYRVFTIHELRKILVISSLRKTIYYIEHMKKLLDNLDTKNYTQLEQSFQLAKEKLNSQLMIQFEGIAELMKYVKLARTDQAKRE